MKSPSASRKCFWSTSIVLALGVALLVLAPGKLHATSITYNLTNVETSAGSLTGTVTISTSTDEVTAANITFNDPTSGNPVYNSPGSQSAYNGLAQVWISGSTGQLALYYDTANVGTGNLTICLATGPECGTNGDETSYAQVYVAPYLSYNLTSGSLDPASAATPEPSSLLLLGTGLFGLGLLVRRQLAA